MAIPQPGETPPRRSVGRRRLVSGVGAAISVLALAWIFWRVDLARLRLVVATADGVFLLLLPLAIAAEQMLRAWKWRQILYGIRPIGPLRLFGAIMAGYFANFLVPLGISPIVRSWLVARREDLKMSAVLATVVIDRLIDGVVFTVFVALALAVAVPGANDEIRLGLIVGGVGGLVLFTLALVALYRARRWAARPNRWIGTLLRRLPRRLSSRIKGLAASFADGILWPAETWRGVGIVLASVAIKVIAMAHFVWAGLAFGIVLSAADYVFLLVFLGFLIILTRLARIPGGFVFGAIFALDLLGVAEEPALAMVVAVQLATMMTVGGIGGFALWKQGFALHDLPHRQAGSNGPT